MKKSKRKIVWTTAYGKSLTMKQIKNDHLVNILRHLIRRKVYQDLRVQIHADCLFGEMDQIFSEYQADQMQRQSVADRFPIFTDLLKEARRRKLVRGGFHE